MDQGLIVADAPSHTGELCYSGGADDIAAIDTGHQHGGNAEGYIARSVKPTGAAPSGGDVDECEENGYSEDSSD